MERIALISDIHGNMPALEAVLDDIAQRGIARIFCLGDLEGRGPKGPAVIDQVRVCCEGVIRGNWEDGLADPGNDHPLARWYQKRLGPNRLAYFRSLPMTIEFMLSGRRIRLLHASPQSVYTHVFPDASPDLLLRMFENTDLTGDGALPDIVIYGDTHQPFWMAFGSRVLLNTGSVGYPLNDQPDATYAIIEGADTAAPATLASTIVRVPYDIERAIQDAIDAKLPDWEVYAEDLRTGRFNGREGNAATSTSSCNDVTT